MSLNGIDVSNHNGKIDWAKVNNEVDFVMIRGGYSLTTDARFEENIKACNALGIPVGVYWFSYSLSKDAVLNEAKKCVEVISKFKVQYPVAFDWEYDSDNYYNKMTGYKLGNEVRAEYATIFLDYIKKAGYVPMLYANVDYIENYGFKAIKDKYKLWLAQWGVGKPKYDCAIWQHTSTGTCDGIKTAVDRNISYENFGENIVQKTVDKEKLLYGIKESYYEKYYSIAKDVISGKYGNGYARKQRLKELNIDYEFVQAIVNVMVS